MISNRFHKIKLSFDPINGRMTFKNTSNIHPGLYIDFSYRTVVEFYELKKNLLTLLTLLEL